jgi:urease accessory protein UreE
MTQHGEGLAAQGDRLRTGEKSLAIVKFKDNSLVRIRERSEVIITGSTSGSGFPNRSR